MIFLSGNRREITIWRRLRAGKNLEQRDLYNFTTTCRFPLRRIGIGSDWTFSILYYPHRRTWKKVENTSTLYHPGCGSQVQTGTENWYRNSRARVQFCSDPISHLFSWVKIGLTLTLNRLRISQYTSIIIFIPVNFLICVLDKQFCLCPELLKCTNCQPCDEQGAI